MGWNSQEIRLKIPRVFLREVTWRWCVCPAQHVTVHLLVVLLFSPKVMSGSLWPHGLQHTRLLCPSLSLRVCTNSCPLSQWCHPNISFSVTCFFCWLLWPLLTKHNFSSKEQASFYFVAAVTICSDFGAQEYKICYCFYFLPTYLP